MKVNVNTSYTIERLLREKQDNILLDDYELQRNSNQYSKQYKSLLIDSVLNGVAIKPITVRFQEADESSVKWLLDGKQRLSILEEFRGTDKVKGFKLTGQLEPIKVKMPKMVQKIKDGVPQYEKHGRKKTPIMVQERDECGHLVYEEQSIKLKGKTFDDLPKPLQDRFLHYQLMPVVELTNCTLEEVQRQMIRENIAMKMTPSQIGTIISGEEVARFTKSFSCHKLFLDQCFLSDNDRNRGGIERIITESIILCQCPESWSDYKKICVTVAEMINSDDSIIPAYKDMIERLSDVLDKVSKRVHNIYEMINSKNMHFIIANFNEFISMDCYADDEYVPFLVEWFNSIKDTTEYNEYDEKSTKAKKNVVARFNIMNAEMERYMSENANVLETEVEYVSEDGNDYALNDTVIKEFNDIKCVNTLNCKKEELLLYTDMMINDYPFKRFSGECIQKYIEWKRERGLTADTIEDSNFYGIVLDGMLENISGADKIMTEYNFPLFVKIVQVADERNIKQPMLEGWLKAFVDRCNGEENGIYIGIGQADFNYHTNECDGSISDVIQAKMSILERSLRVYIDNKREIA